MGPISATLRIDVEKTHKRLTCVIALLDFGADPCDMAVISPGIVRIAKSATESYGDAMRRYRFWLDHEKIQCLSFKPTVFQGSVGFELAFAHSADAELFDRQFG